MSATKNCIVCFDKATGYGGHVHKGEDTIAAGYCRTHFKTVPMNQECKGCLGDWTEEMGIDNSFGQLMYIDEDGLHPIDEE